MFIFVASFWLGLKGYHSPLSCVSFSVWKTASLLKVIICSGTMLSLCWNPKPANRQTDTFFLALTMSVYSWLDVAIPFTGTISPPSSMARGALPHPHSWSSCWGRAEDKANPASPVLQSLPLGYPPFLNITLIFHSDNIRDSIGHSDFESSSTSSSILLSETVSFVWLFFFLLECSR